MGQWMGGGGLYHSVQQGKSDWREKREWKPQITMAKEKLEWRWKKLEDKNRNKLDWVYYEAEEKTKQNKTKKNKKKTNKKKTTQETFPERLEPSLQCGYLNCRLHCELTVSCRPQRHCISSHFLPKGKALQPEFRSDSGPEDQYGDGRDLPAASKAASDLCHCWISAARHTWA